MRSPRRRIALGRSASATLGFWAEEEFIPVVAGERKKVQQED